MKLDLNTLLEQPDGVEARDLDEPTLQELIGLIRFAPHTLEITADLNKASGTRGGWISAAYDSVDTWHLNVSVPDLQRTWCIRRKRDGQT